MMRLIHVEIKESMRKQMTALEYGGQREDFGRSWRQIEGKANADGWWTVLRGGPTCKTVNGEARAAFSMINPVPPTPRI